MIWRTCDSALICEGAHAIQRRSRRAYTYAHLLQRNCTHTPVQEYTLLTRITATFQCSAMQNELNWTVNRLVNARAGRQFCGGPRVEVKRSWNPEHVARCTPRAVASSVDVLDCAALMSWSREAALPSTTQATMCASPPRGRRIQGMFPASDSRLDSSSRRGPIFIEWLGHSGRSRWRREDGSLQVLHGRGAVVAARRVKEGVQGAGERSERERVRGYKRSDAE
eukprot:IDg21838t1